MDRRRIIPQPPCLMIKVTRTLLHGWTTTITNADTNQVLKQEHFLDSEDEAWTLSQDLCNELRNVAY